MILLRRAAIAALVLLLAGCGAEDLSKTPPPLGNFELGYNIVVAKNAKPVGPSRPATAAEWEASLKAAVAERIGRYDGGKLYHLGVGVEAYALAVPGIPVVLSPKSVLAITVNVWDDTAQRIINAEPKQLTVFENFSGSTLIGSGLTKSREQQMETLSRNAARKIDEWLIANKAWFTPEAAAARAVLTPMSGVPGTAAGAAPGPAAEAAPGAGSEAGPADAATGTAPAGARPKRPRPAPPGQTIGLP